MNAVQRRRAVIAFLFHAPWLALLDASGRAALPRGWFVPNVLALGATLATCVYVYRGWGGWAAFAVWAIGHFGWSVYLAMSVAKAATR